MCLYEVFSRFEMCPLKFENVKTVTQMTSYWSKFSLQLLNKADIKSTNLEYFSLTKSKKKKKKPFHPQNTYGFDR